MTEVYHYDLRFFDIIITRVQFLLALPAMRLWGTCPLDFQHLIFSVKFRAAQSLTASLRGCLSNHFKPNSITLSGRRQVRSWSQTCSELEFGLSSSSLAAS